MFRSICIIDHRFRSDHLRFWRLQLTNQHGHYFFCILFAIVDMRIQRKLQPIDQSRRLCSSFPHRMVHIDAGFHSVHRTDHTPRIQTTKMTATRMVGLKFASVDSVNCALNVIGRGIPAALKTASKQCKLCSFCFLVKHGIKAKNAVKLKLLFIEKVLQKGWTGKAAQRMALVEGRTHDCDRESAVVN